jgi:hypothetical protein
MAFPAVGAIARLILTEIKKDRTKYNRILRNITKDTEKMAKDVAAATKKVIGSFTDFVDKSKAMRDAIENLKSAASFDVFQDIGTAFEGLAKDTQINIDLFDQLVASGVSYQEAFQRATTTAEEFAAAQKRIQEEDKEWLITLGKVTTAIAGVTGVLRVAQREFNEAIETYSDLAEETRRITLQTGLAVEEASIWAKTAEIQNVSARSLAAGFAQVSRNLTNMQLRLAAGQKDNTTFTRTLKALGIEVRDSTGNFKTASDIVSEVNAKIRELGPGWQAAGVAQNVYGRGATSLLPIILDQSISIEEISQLMTDMGAVMTDLDKEAFGNLIASSARLNIANQAVANTISREYIPILTSLNNTWASVLEFINKVDKQLRAFSAGFRAITNPIVDFVREFQEVSKQVAGDESVPGVIRATLGPLRAFRLTLQKIKEEGLESQSVFEAYQEELGKLNGVTEDAADAENELTAERQAAIDALFAEADSTDALNKVLEDQKKVVQDLTDAWEDFQNRQEDINRRFDDQLADLEIRQGRARLARNLRLSFALEDIHVKRGRRLRDLTIDAASRQESVQRDLNRKLEDFERDAARAREKIWVKNRENLLRIENTFNDTIEEAARTNDTVAVVRAIRNRNRQQRDETRRFSVEQQELEKDLAIKRDKIREQQFKDEIDDLIRKNKRELILSRNKDNERRADIERNRTRALRDAEIFYEREKLALQTHLRELNVIAVLGVMNTTQEIARATADGIAHLSSITAAAISTASSNFVGGAMRIGGGGLSQTPTSPGAPSGSLSLIDLWRQTGNQSFFRQHGGVDVVNRPTTFVAGEAGAEIAAFIPLSQSRNINHSFGKLPIDFQGLPGGMDTSQVQSIVYNAMIELARTLGTSRR